MNDDYFEDQRAASHYFEEEWVQDMETLFTLPEILWLFQ